MKKIKKYEEIINAEESVNLKEVGVNPRLYWAYRECMEETGNELIDFSDMFLDSDVKDIVKEIKEYGIKEFTISSNMSSMVQTLAEFDKLGVKMQGLVEINSRFTRITSDELRKIPAIKMVVEK